IDGRTDLYATGVILFLALTGRRPFERDTRSEVIQAHLTAPPASLVSIRPGLPRAGELDAVIGRALAKSPDDRFQTAQEMRRTVVELLGGTLSPGSRKFYKQSGPQPGEARIACDALGTLSP